MMAIARLIALLLVRQISFGEVRLKEDDVAKSHTL